jgi:hypothetical protein
MKATEDKKRLATDTFTESIQFIINASTVLGSSKKTRGRLRPLVEFGIQSVQKFQPNIRKMN